MDKPPEISGSSIDHDTSNLNELALGYPRDGVEFEPIQELEQEEEIFLEQEENEKCYIPVIQETEFYLERRRINDFLQFMMNHLLVNEPDDPIEYLTQLLDKCLMFRSGILASPPVLFEDRHVSSLYTSFDPLNMGSITVKQYCIGMTTLGLNDKQFNKNPERLRNGNVSKEIFLKNAKLALVENLMDMVMLPPPFSDGGTSSIETFLH